MSQPGYARSSFLDPGPVATAGSLAVLHLKRGLSLPTKLADHVSEHEHEGYEEGRVTNTRFGSFPHSTLIGLPWGTQVRASQVDTGSRGRKGLIGREDSGKKRKREGTETESTPFEEADGIESASATKTAVTASSGFIHLLPPTPETWTTSLPHRTQVVYTPDYSYILHRLRVRPGSVIIEAGAGSGSFTHAAARAVYSGYDDSGHVGDDTGASRPRRVGRVLSYEFHEQRAEKLRSEINEHGLEDIVQITHRDVYDEGFLLDSDSNGIRSTPVADAVFLDLPAPWLALRHLTRSHPPTTETNATDATAHPKADPFSVESSSFDIRHDGNARSDSPLNAQVTVRLCTFSPCIEQVQRTALTMRQLGWVDIEMVEIAQKRLEVRRERVGLQEEAQRGVHVAAGSVDEAVTRLREVEGRFKTFHAETNANKKNPMSRTGNKEQDLLDSAQDGGTDSLEDIEDRRLYSEGRLVHRVEPDLKTHTSYLVFAVLPQEWTAEDEEKARTRWPVQDKATAHGNQSPHVSKRQARRAAHKISGPIEVAEATMSAAEG